MLSNGEYISQTNYSTGHWTINYVLLRGFGWLDALLHGDIAVRRGLQKLLASPNKMSEKQVQQWLEQFSPWRALVAVHLWAFGSASNSISLAIT